MNPNLKVAGWGGNDHVANGCKLPRCLNCDASGHRAVECGEVLLCNVCLVEDHVTSCCPFILFSANVDAKDISGLAPFVDAVKGQLKKPRHPLPSSRSSRITIKLPTDLRIERGLMRRERRPRRRRDRRRENVERGSEERWIWNVMTNKDNGIEAESVIGSVCVSARVKTSAIDASGAENENMNGTIFNVRRELVEIIIPLWTSLTRMIGPKCEGNDEGDLWMTIIVRIEVEAFLLADTDMNVTETIID